MPIACISTMPSSCRTCAMATQFWQDDGIVEMAIVARAHGIAMLTLVSVYGTSRLWARCGFTERHTPALAAKLAAYGPSAHYMVRSV